MKTRLLLLLLTLALPFPLGAAEPRPAWPSLAEQLRADKVLPHSALEALIAANQDFSLLRPEEVRDRIGLPPWLRVLWRRAHPGAGPSAADPAGGYPFLLREIHEWMLLHQDLVPGPPGKDAPSDLDEDVVGKVTAVGADRRISGPQDTSRSESDIRVNPWNPLKIVGSANNLSGGGQAQFYSTDGGVTWGQTNLPLQPGELFQGDPTVDWTSDGTAWATTIGISGGFSVLQLRAYKSTDGGSTWTFDSTFSGAQTQADKEILWADHSSTSPFKDNLYVIWHNDAPAFMARRTGGIWQAPVQVSGAETTGTGIGGDVKTNAFGDVFGFWPDSGSRKVFVIKSTNGGASYGTPVQIATTSGDLSITIPAQNNRSVLIYLAGGAYRTASKNLVYASWTDLISGCSDPGGNAASPCKTRIWFTRSTNGGTTWSAPVKINDQVSLNDQFHPRLVVDESNGALGIIYYDTVADPRRVKADAWYQASHDDGATWSPATKVTSAQTDETVPGADLGNQFGDYNGLSGIGGQFFSSWTDRRNEAHEEIWTAKITDSLCTNPGAPAIGSASVAGLNQIQVSWGNGSPAASAFNVYRAAGTCAAPGAFSRVASALAGSPYLDAAVSGGSSYAYQVRGTDASGACESAASACVEATATGACRTPPAFAGLASVANRATAVCGLALSWPAAAPACGGPITYNVYRSTDPALTPAAGNRIAGGVTGTGFVDIPPASGSSFFYVVRAVDGANGVEESNTVIHGSTPTGPGTYLLNETFERPSGFDTPGWTHVVYAGDFAFDWAWSTAQAESATHSWFSPSAGSNVQKALISPSVVPQAGSILSFWHTYSFEDGAGCYDAGMLQVSTDNGATWNLMPDAAFQSGGFNGAISFGSSNGYANSRAWCHGTIGAMTQVLVDLSSYAGSAVKLRWLESDDNLIGFTGWYVDDVTVGTAATCAPAGLFSDGFESGALGAWSGTVP